MRVTLRAAALGGALLFVAAWSVAARRGSAAPPIHGAVLVVAPSMLRPVLVTEVEEPPPARAAVGVRMRVTLTAYCLDGITAEGTLVRPGLVAADPRVFPLGSEVEVYVDGRHLGTHYVGDTGRLIKGPILDVWIEECDEAIRFGRRRGWATLLPAAPEVPE